MKFCHLVALRLLMVAALALGLPSHAADAPREHLSLDANWKFHLGDDWPGALHLDKAGASTRPGVGKIQRLVLARRQSAARLGD